MLWYRELGFHNNPFSIKPAAFHNNVIGYDLSEIFEKITNAQILFIEGKYGFGKTTILKNIINEFRGNREVAYYNCNRADGTINTEQILQGKYGFLGKMLGMMPNNMILLLDEVEKLSKEDQQELMEFYNQGNIRSIIFFGPNFEDVGFSVEFKKQMVDNVIQLTDLTETEAVELVRERIGNLNLLSDKMIKEIFSRSEKNPRLFLENTEDISRYAVENNEDEVTEEHINEVLGSKPKKKKTAKPKKRETKKQETKKNEQQETEPDEIQVEPAEEPEYFY